MCTNSTTTMRLSSFHAGGTPVSDAQPVGCSWCINASIHTSFDVNGPCEYDLEFAVLVRSDRRLARRVELRKGAH